MQLHVLILIIPETLGLTKFYFHGDSIYVLYKIQNAFNDSSHFWKNTLNFVSVVDSSNGLKLHVSVP